MAWAVVFPRRWSHTERIFERAGGSGAMSGTKDILSVWEKSCMSGSLLTVHENGELLRHSFLNKNVVLFLRPSRRSPTYFLTFYYYFFV